MTRVLIGGGWTPAAAPAVWGPFLAAAGSEPSIACVLVDEGDGADYFERFAAALTSVATCRPVPVLLPLGSELPVGFLDRHDGLLVGGGRTPAYAAALAPMAATVRSWVDGGRPYAGFSAGSAVAAARALVGGYRSSGRTVCPEDAAEELDELTVVAGLGLVSFAVDVHAAQWGTLGRLAAAVSSGLVAAGVAVDEDTALVVTGDATAVAGLGAVHVVTPAAGGVQVRSLTAGEPFSLPA